MKVRTKTARGRDSKAAEVKPITSSGNGNLKQLVREIETFLRAKRPPQGVDTLLTQPIEAMKLALDVGRAVERVTPAEWNKCAAAIAVFEMTYAPLIAVINDVCRAAMNGRKRGEIKPAVAKGRQHA